MTVTTAPHRRTGQPTILAQCDTCTEAVYLGADPSYEMRDATAYLTRIGWTITGPSYAPTSATCPAHQEAAA